MAGGDDRVFTVDLEFDSSVSSDVNLIDFVYSSIYSNLFFCIPVCSGSQGR